jgi:hypothetical protein
MKEKVQAGNPSRPTRTVFAPQSVSIGLTQLPVNRVISVELEENEEIKWTWTAKADGQPYVSGYTIIPKCRS